MAPDDDRATRRLDVAVWASVLEVGVQAAVLIAAGALGGAPLRVVFLLAKLPFARLAQKRHPGGYLALWIYEFAALAAAIGVGGSAVLRAGFGLGALTVMVLLGRAISAFPPVEWKTR